MDDLEAFAATMTLSQLDRPACPLLVVHGENVHLVDESQIAAMQACADDLLKVWGLDPDKHKAMSAPAVPNPELMVTFTGLCEIAATPLRRAEMLMLACWWSGVMFTTP